MFCFHFIGIYFYGQFLYQKKTVKISWFHKKFSYYQKNPMTLARYDKFEASHKIWCKSVSICSLQACKMTKGLIYLPKVAHYAKLIIYANIFLNHCHFQLDRCIEYVHTKNHVSSLFETFTIKRNRR